MILFIRSQCLSAYGVILKAGMQRIFTVQQIASVKYNGQTHHFSYLDKICHGKLFPLRCNDEYLRITRTLIHIIHNIDIVICQSLSTRGSRLGVIRRHVRAFITQTLDKFDSNGLTNIIRVLLKRKPPYGNAFFARLCGTRSVDVYIFR